MSTVEHAPEIRRYVVARAADIPEGDRLIVEVAGRQVGIFRVDGEYGDGWIPGYREFGAERVAELRARAERSIDIQVWGVPAEPAVLAELEDMGVSRALYWLPAAGRPGVEAALERWELAIADAHGE